MNLFWIIISLCMHHHIYPADGKPTMPPLDHCLNGYQTLNQRGYVFNPNDPISLQSINDIATHRNNNARTNILEIGPGYGLLAEEILRKFHVNNCCTYTAIDLDANHLTLATQRMQQYISPTSNTQWITKIGSFPETVTTDLENSFTHVIACRVFHFFTPNLLKKALCTIEKILQPNGQAYIYTAHIETDICGPELYTLYLKEKTLKKEFPGFIENPYETLSNLVQQQKITSTYFQFLVNKNMLAPHFLFMTTPELCEIVHSNTKKLKIVSTNTFTTYNDNNQKISYIGLVLKKNY